jgi:2-(1,2-epoxy-1,2-dihydrophenyl)acetyl-CoA isomerase
MTILFDQQGAVAIITLNRPDKMNAFNLPMLKAWRKALETCETDAAIRVVVITGAGRAFCAGGDVDEMAERIDEKPDVHTAYLRDNVHPVALAIRTLPKPVIAAVNGVATGAGMDMALWCDLRFAAEHARFAETYIKVGVVPGDGGAYLLPRLVGVGKALEMLWTGTVLTAQEALELGIVNRIYPAEMILSETIAFAHELAKGPAMAMGLIKRSVYESLTLDPRAHLDLISSHFGRVAQESEHHEWVKSFTEKKHVPSF